MNRLSFKTWIRSLMEYIFINNFLNIINIQNPIDISQKLYRLNPTSDDVDDQEKFNDSSKSASSRSYKLFLFFSIGILLHNGILPILGRLTKLAKSFIQGVLHKPYRFFIKHTQS